MKFSQHLFAGILLILSFMLIYWAPHLNSLGPDIFSNLFPFKKANASAKIATPHHISEIKNLRKALAINQLKILKLKEQVASLTKFRQKFSLTNITFVIPASITVRRDGSDNRRSFQIDRGLVDGVKLGDTVVFGDYLLGRVHQLGRHSCSVLHVTDPAMKIPVTVMEIFAKNNKKLYGDGICAGRSKENSQLELVERHEHLPEVAVVITSGLKEEYPQGLIVGEVVKDKKPPHGLFWDAFVQPVDIKKIRTVLVFTFEKKLSEDS